MSKDKTKTRNKDQTDIDSLESRVPSEISESRERLSPRVIQIPCQDISFGGNNYYIPVDQYKHALYNKGTPITAYVETVNSSTVRYKSVSSDLCEKLSNFIYSGNSLKKYPVVRSSTETSIGDLNNFFKPLVSAAKETVAEIKRNSGRQNKKQ